MSLYITQRILKIVLLLVKDRMIFQKCKSDQITVWLETLQ